MGSPLSPVLANLFMEYFECELLPTLPNQPSFWARYVDDIIIFWPDNQNFQQFFARINSLVPSIKFSTEWEKEDVLPFLDMSIQRLTSGFTYSIYRKPTHSNQYIHYFSCQPEHVKRGSVFSLILRAYRLCDQVHLKKELDFIVNSFMKVGFPKHIIEEVHSKVKSKIFRITPTCQNGDSEQLAEEEQKPIINLPHNNFVSKYVKPVFNANNFRVVNGAQNTLRSKLVANKPPRSVDAGALPGVYSVPCENCSSRYFGETGRGLQVRINEHKNSVARLDQNNAFYRHQRETQNNTGSMHNIKWDEAKLIHVNSNWYDRLIIESSLIKCLPNFNGMNSTLGIDQFAAKLVLNSIHNLKLDSL